MSVVMGQTFAPTHVQTLLGASLVDVIMEFSWMLLGLLVMVCRSIMHKC